MMNVNRVNRGVRAFDQTKGSLLPSGCSVKAVGRKS